MNFMKRLRIDRYIATMLCLLAALYVVIGVQWVRRAPTPVAGIITVPGLFAGDPLVRSHLRDHIQLVWIDEVPLAAALDQLKSQTHARIAVRWDQLNTGGVVPETPVSAVLSDVDLDTALRVILRSANSELDYGVLDGGTILVTRGPYDAPMSMVGYDVRDIIPPPHPAPPPVVFTQSSGGGGGAGGGRGMIGGGPPRDYPDGDGELCETINACLRHPDADPPVNQPPATADIWANRLIVVGTPRTHRQVESILRQLRATDIKHNAELRSTP